MLLLATIAAVFGYVVLVEKLRFRRRNSLSQKYPYQDRQSFARMTLEDAFEIQLSLAELEFPIIFSTSVFFALFKTYGIPSISKLLVATGELADPASSSKRAADTGVLITEIVLNKPRSDRNLDAIARMNWLHDRYRKAGKIKDEDMLYTLSLFVLEPVRWTERFEWRALSDVERCALAVYWKSLGEVMDIPYEVLPSAESGWQDGLHWLEELEAWSKQYGNENTVPDEHNRTLALATLRIGLTNVPRILHSVGMKFVAALLDQRLQQAMMLEEPTWVIQTALDMVVILRKFLIRHIFLPRPESLRSHWFTSDVNALGRYHFMQYIGHPWYIKPTLTRRWNFNSWVLWLTGGFVPSKYLTEYRPNGYQISELGPVSLEGKGIDEMQSDKQRIGTMLQGCPFSHLQGKTNAPSKSSSPVVSRNMTQRRDVLECDP
ncbi:uncharacterized protein N7483_004524 [Penicillium malachiteum]|uniref:uncharacterized protein n=1 Tax=Penicillium malachiteum TaxID=1324776 RepID=UPI002547183C|nr:uncharacterized protein N7483_004524 [Penicillium malachiteum]KAJ5730016.1 hypothetical protein N7483_004524 [Penicillium malachiteum]